MTSPASVSSASSSPAARERSGGLAAWQWRDYPRVHTARANLALHIATAPIFFASCLTLAGTPFLALTGRASQGGWRMALAALVGLVLAVAAQGRGHRLEPEPPAPFRGPLDVLARLFLEQLFTFPKFVLTGGFARAWRKAS
jgi:hypothetical protein